jgi:hypothetical protein
VGRGGEGVRRHLTAIARKESTKGKGG